MSVAEKHMANGEMLLKEFNLDMAAFYFETAADMYLNDADFQNAIKAYEKVLYCYDSDDKTEMAEKIRQKIVALKEKN